MDHLKRHYRDSLKRRIATLEEYREILRTEPEQLVTIAEIRGLAHSLKGSGATYGFASISETAAVVENAALDQLTEALDDFLIILRQTVAALASVGEEPSPPQAGS